MQEAKEYASIAGTLLYHALDGPDVRGVDVGGHEAAAEAPGLDEALLEVHGRATVLRMEVRLPRVAQRAGDLD